MASVIHSARTSTASLFDTVGTAANVINQTLGTGALAIDALNSKAQLMHKGVATHTRARLVTIEHEEIVKAASEHADFMETVFKRRYPTQDFNWTKAYDEAVTEIQAAVKAA